MHDYSEDVEIKPDQSELLGQVATLALLMRERAAEMEAAEQKAKAAKAAYEDVAERQLPELMDSLGLANITTADGLRVAVDENIFASIAGARKHDALTWLDEHNHGGLIKREVIVNFAREQEEAAKALLDELRGKFNVKQDRSVHGSTLKSWVKSMLENGEDFPLELFGVFRKRVAKIQNK